MRYRLARSTRNWCADTQRQFNIAIYITSTVAEANQRVLNGIEAKLRARSRRASEASTCVRSEEKKRKKDEKTALRKAQRAEAELPTSQTSTEEKRLR